MNSSEIAERERERWGNGETGGKTEIKRRNQGDRGRGETICLFVRFCLRSQKKDE